MRIIGGKWRGRRVHIPSKSWPVRPTTDFAREALFNILDNRLEYEHASSLDLFGGTGMHSIELVSRGCGDVTYVDRYKESVRFMQSYVKQEQMPIKVILSDVRKFISTATRQWDYIFADPPYDMKDIELFPAFLLDSNILTPEGFFILEHSSIFHFQQIPGFKEARHYGQTVFSFFSPAS